VLAKGSSGQQCRFEALRAQSAAAEQDVRADAQTESRCEDYLGEKTVSSEVVMLTKLA